jgi:hypothetical protein
MIFRCDSCGLSGTAYMERPTQCSRCGSTKLWFLHYEFPPYRTANGYHEVLIDVANNELLSHDPCDDLGGGLPNHLLHPV